MTGVKNFLVLKYMNHLGETIKFDGKNYFQTHIKCAITLGIMRAILIKLKALICQMCQQKHYQFRFIPEVKVKVLSFLILFRNI